MVDREPAFLREDGPANGPPTPGSQAARPTVRTERAAPAFYVAGFWRRVGGSLIDAGLVLPVALLLCWLAGRMGGVALPPSRHRGIDFWLDLLLISDPALWGAIGLVTAITVLYLLLFQIVLGETPGMRVTRTRIIDVYGDSPSAARAVVRTLGYLVSVMTLGLGFLWVGFDSERRGLHDWLAGTYVVLVHPPQGRHES
jgi:uncharacterized RDD family membrane protein YckC